MSNWLEWLVIGIKKEGGSRTFFSDFLHMDILKQIASFELFHDDYVKESLYWRGDSPGRFKIKSAIGVICKVHDAMIGDSWDWVWKIKAPQRCKMLIRLALHSRLLTNANSEKQRLTNDPLCPLCELEYENVEHVIRRCLEAQYIWSYFFSKRLGIRVENLGFQEWIKAIVLDCQVEKDWSAKIVLAKYIMEAVELGLLRPDR